MTHRAYRLTDVRTYTRNNVRTSHETPDVAFRSATPTSWNCLPKKDVKYSPMGNTAVLQRYLKHKPIMLLKRYIWISSLVICFYFWGQLVWKPDIDVSRHLQKMATELRDGSWIFIFRTGARGKLICIVNKMAVMIVNRRTRVRYF